METKRPVWYTKPSFVRTRTNHIWTKKEIKQVFALRIKKLPVDRIINELNLDVRRVQVYNVLRTIKKSRKNRCCQCGQDLSNGEKLAQRGKYFKKCDSCKEKNLLYKKWKRNDNITKGVCGYCGKRPILKGRKACLYCLSYTYRQHLSKGKCGHCGERPISAKSESLCNPCLKLNRTNVQQHRKELENANY